MSDVHYHLDGYTAHPGKECKFCEGRNKTYLFNVMTTIEVIANTEEEAYDILNDSGGEIKDRDVMLVMVQAAPSSTISITEDSHLEMEYEERFMSDEE